MNREKEEEEEEGSVDGALFAKLLKKM